MLPRRLVGGIRIFSSAGTCSATPLRPIQERRRILAVHEFADLNSSCAARVQGWVRRVNKTSAATFLHVGDGLSTDTVQIVVPRGVVSSAGVGCAIRARGNWQRVEGRKHAGELTADEVQVLASDREPRYASLSPDNLRKDLSLRAKSDAFAAVLRLRSRLTLATHQFFQKADFVHVDTPIVTANDCEGAGETFLVQTESTPSPSSSDSFFGHDVFLSVSSQLHLEAAAVGLARVYSLARAFRAEKNQSSTHMTEFSMLEAELAFCDDLSVLMDLVEEYVRGMAVELCAESGPAAKDAEALGPFSEMTRQVFTTLASCPSKIPRLSHSDAIAMLKDIGHKLPSSGSLSRSAELALVESIGGPVFVTHFPSSHKPFYMKRNGDGTTESFDLLMPFVGEMAGGSLRVDRREELERQCDGGRLPDALQWYGDLRDRGKGPSGGFGIGFERLLQCLLEIRNIKDTTAFPRWFKHCQC